MRTLVLGDIHGAHKALLQCFELSGFDREKDRLIFLGDATDGWSQSPEAIEELRSVRNLTYILGNHDLWFMMWVSMGVEPIDWLAQGGQATIDAYSRQEWRDRRREHLEFLKYGEYYYHDKKDRLFVHGGIRPDRPLNSQDTEMMTWDRSLFYAVDGVRGFREIYIGHTPTLNVEHHQPLNFGDSDNIWRMDTGAGWDGRLSIMDIDSRKCWQSEPVCDLYPREQGRL